MRGGPEDDVMDCERDFLWPYSVRDTATCCSSSTMTLTGANRATGVDHHFGPARRGNRSRLLDGAPRLHINVFHRQVRKR